MIQKNRGFIALFTVIIISFVLLMMTLTLNSASLFGRFNILETEFKEQTSKLADACIEVARLARATGNYEIGVRKKVIINLDTGLGCEYKFISSSNVKICSHLKNIKGAQTFYDIFFSTGDPALPLNGFSEVGTVPQMCID